VKRYPGAENVLERIHLMHAFDMVTLVEACESIQRSLSERVPIELVVIDTVANPISLLMNRGQIEGCD